jgi:hypothetical protein
MIDVRLTATNPEDSTLVPVPCNARGELLTVAPKIESIPNDVEIDGDLTVNGLINGRDPAEPGPPGPPGPDGPPGSLPLDVQTYSPVYQFTDNGAATIQYGHQEGKSFRLGDLVIVTGYISTRSVFITNPRGNVLVTLPDYVDTDLVSTVRAVTFHDRWNSGINIISGGIYRSPGVMMPMKYNEVAGKAMKELETTDFREGDEPKFCNHIEFLVVGTYLAPDEIARRKQMRKDITAALSGVTSTTDID